MALIQQSAHAIGINVLATGLTTLLLTPTPAGAVTPADLRFFAQFRYVLMRALVGTFTTAPTFRIGSNAAHTNVAPAFTPSPAGSIAVDSVVELAGPAGLKAINLATDSIIFEVLTAGVGPSVATVDVLLIGAAIRAGANWPRT